MGSSGAAGLCGRRRGRWHVVLNIDPLSIAVTENFGNLRDFAPIRAALRAKRPDIDIDSWVANVEQRWPGLTTQQH